MSASIVFGGKVSHKGLSFPRLTMKHYGELEHAFRSFRRETITASLHQQATLSPIDRARLLTEFESKPISWVEVDDWLQTRDGAMAGVETLLKITEEKFNPEELSIVDASQIARLAIGTLELPPSGSTQNESGK